MKKPEYKPLLFTTTLRNPERLKGLLSILLKFNAQILTDKLAEQIVGEIIRYGLYRPMRQNDKIKKKWKGTPKGEFSYNLLSDSEIKYLLKNNPQNHQEAGFSRGWASRFATLFDFPKELGFVYFKKSEKINFSEIGLKLAKSIKVKKKGDNILVKNVDPEFEQKAFLHALTKYQRQNPFIRVLNDNSPLILLLHVIRKLNADKEFNNTGISKLEIPFILFWKDQDAEKLYQLIKKVRKKYKYTPSQEIIISICKDDIMGGKLKKFNPKSITGEYPDEFIRKMRLTGLISLRGAGRFIDINKNENKKIDYILKNYSQYKKFKTEKEYFNYMADVDENLISLTTKPLDTKKKGKFLEKWIEFYSFKDIKRELEILSNTSKKQSKDKILKYLYAPTRLEFLTALAIKSKFPHVEVLPNYPCDDEGLPTSTAGGVGDKGDIECYENTDGILIEVTMSAGRTQTIMEVWPITRHLEEFSKKTDRAICYFVAPSIYIDSERQIDYVKKREGYVIHARTIKEFLENLETQEKLYFNP